MRFIETAALAGLLMAAAPLAAQSTNEAAPPPPPAGDAVGPPQLRDFNLNGAATQPVQPATPTPSPTPPQQPSPSAPAPGTATTDEPRATTAPAAPAPAPAQRRPANATPDRNPARDAVTVDLPPTDVAPIVAEPSFAPAPPPVSAPAVEAPLAVDEPGTSWWPWIAALLALGLGAAFLWWRARRDGRELYAADRADLSSAVALPAAPPVPLPRAAATPPVSPRQAPQAPAGAAPRPLPSAPPAPAPAASPVPAPAATPAPPPPPPSGGIVASGLKPRIEFDLVPIRAETDATEGAALTVDIIVMNRGSAPARDVLVEAQLINAGPQVDAEVGRFFVRPAGSGERIPVIPPMQSVAIKIRLEVPAANISPLVVEGRKLLVPLVAVNAFYRWSGGEMLDSSSFLVGRGDSEGGKMAPFRLDQGARSWSGLGARLHSSGLQR